MQINQLSAALINTTVGIGNTAKGTSDAASNNDFMKLVEQLLGGDNCESNTYGNGSALINGNDVDQNALSETNGKQLLTLSTQPMQTSAAENKSSVIQSQNPADKLTGSESTQQAAAVNLPKNGIQQEQSDAGKTNPDILQTAKLIIKMQQALNDALNAGNSPVLDANTMKVLNLLSQVAQKLVKADTGTDEKTETDKINTEKNPASVNQQQISLLSAIATQLQLTTQATQSVGITDVNIQTDSAKENSTVSINANVKNIVNSETAQTEQTGSDKNLSTYAPNISASELQLTAHAMQSTGITVNKSQTDSTQKNNTVSINTNVKNIVNPETVQTEQIGSDKSLSTDAPSISASELQLTAHAMQSTGITGNKTQTDSTQKNNTVSINTNVKNIVNPETAQTEQTGSDKSLSTYAPSISASKLQTSENGFSISEELQNLFTELNITDIQSLDAPQQVQTPQSSQAIFSIKSLCENVSAEVNAILQAAQANQGDIRNIESSGILDLLNSTNLKADTAQAKTIQTDTLQIRSADLQCKTAQDISNIVYNLNSSGKSNEPVNNMVLQTDSKADVSMNIDSQNTISMPQYSQSVINSSEQSDIASQALQMTASITPFQSIILDKKVSCDKDSVQQSGASQNDSTNIVLKLTQDEVIKQVQLSSDKNQGDALKSNIQDASSDKQDATATAVNGNVFNSIQTFSVYTSDSSDNSTAQIIVKQTSDAIAQAAGTGQKDIKLHLSPADLGGITVKMISKNGALSIQIITDNPHTGQLLSGSISDLNTALGHHGITVEKSEIIHTGENSSFNTGDFSQQRQQSQNRQSEQKTEQYVQSESSVSWSPIMQNVKEQANQYIPQVMTRNYDIMA